MQLKIYNFIYHAIAMYVPATNMPPTCQLLCVQIWDNYVSLYTSYEHISMNIVISNTVTHVSHITGICLSKYACHIPQICPTAVYI